MYEDFAEKLEERRCPLGGDQGLQMAGIRGYKLCRLPAGGEFPSKKPT
jgi:hypothetical protein